MCTACATGARDEDGDGRVDCFDNCVSVANPTQANNDLDAPGDLCDEDDDNDGIADGVDRTTAGTQSFTRSKEWLAPAHLGVPQTGILVGASSGVAVLVRAAPTTTWGTDVTATRTSQTSGVVSLRACATRHRYSLRLNAAGNASARFKCGSTTIELLEGTLEIDFNGVVVLLEAGADITIADEVSADQATIHVNPASTGAVTVDDAVLEAGDTIDLLIPDECPADPDKVAPDVCGCGTPDSDADGDATPDCDDACPDHAHKVEPGVCGCAKADADHDGDGTMDCVDADVLDADDDGIADAVDSCVGSADPGQRDADLDGLGDACDPDSDADGFEPGDNCPRHFNADQADLDGDAQGDACDDDIDGDGVDNDIDECPATVAGDAAFFDGCSLVQACPGGCTCDAGFTLGGDGRSCVDVDECALGNGGCAPPLRQRARLAHLLVPGGLRARGRRRRVRTHPRLRRGERGVRRRRPRHAGRRVRRRQRPRGHRLHLHGGPVRARLGARRQRLRRDLRGQRRGVRRRRRDDEGRPLRRRRRLPRHALRLRAERLRGELGRKRRRLCDDAAGGRRDVRRRRRRHRRRRRATRSGPAPGPPTRVRRARARRARYRTASTAASRSRPPARRATTATTARATTCAAPSTLARALHIAARPGLATRARCPMASAARSPPKASGAACDDGDACTEDDACSAGACSGEAIDCASAGDACNTGVCDAVSGECRAEPIDQEGCEDGQPTEVVEVVSGGGCQSGTPLSLLAALLGMLALLVRRRAKAARAGH